MAKRVTAFSWGYDGWGSAPEKFVESVDVVEAARGFGPPVFVDVRFSRNVRAPGFREKTFETLLGANRYRWMKGLGNERIREGGIRIHEPKQAEVLLDLVEQADKERRRVIFFCSCPSPGTPENLGCHRVLVGGLLLEAAQRRGVGLEVVEWPGGEPAEREVDCDDATITKVLNGAAYLDLEDKLPLVEAAGLAYATELQLNGEGMCAGILVCPARFHAGKWQLRVAYRQQHAEDSLAKQAEQMRAEFGWNPRSVAGGAAHVAR